MLASIYDAAQGTVSLIASVYLSGNKCRKGQERSYLSDTVMSCITLSGRGSCFSQALALLCTLGGSFETRTSW